MNKIKRVDNPTAPAAMWPGSYVVKYTAVNFQMWFEQYRVLYWGHREKFHESTPTVSS